MKSHRNTQEVIKQIGYLSMNKEKKDQILSQILSQMELGSLARDLKPAIEAIPDRQTN